MAATYEVIATQTLGSTANSVTFSSIPQTYTDIIAVINGASTADTSGFLRVGNGSLDTGTNYSVTHMYGNRTSVASGRESNQNQAFNGNLRTSFDFVANVHFMNYSNTSIYKTWLSRPGNAGNWVWDITGLWRSTSAINTIAFIADGTTWQSGSTFTLYGIKAA